MTDPASQFPRLGPNAEALGLQPRLRTSDNRFLAGNSSVQSIASTQDGKVEFVGFPDHTLALVNSALGYPAYYPVHPSPHPEKVQAVLMDLDGTTVHSEEFWMWIIERTLATLLGTPSFRLEEADLPHVSGHSVSEHLLYCIHKYGPGKSLDTARNIYFTLVSGEMKAILEGTGKKGAFRPAPGLKNFLLRCKSQKIRIGLVTSGLHEKAWPEILDAFRTLGLGNPADFYDAIITAGTAIRPGSPGTLGELCSKPHPWLYAEAARVGLGFTFAQRGSVVGIEDSGAGVCSIRLAGLRPLGMKTGNLSASGTQSLCENVFADLQEAEEYLFGTTVESGK